MIIMASKLPKADIGWGQKEGFKQCSRKYTADQYIKGQYTWRSIILCGASGKVYTPV